MASLSPRLERRQFQLASKPQSEQTRRTVPLEPAELLRHADIKRTMEHYVEIETDELFEKLRRLQVTVK